MAGVGDFQFFLPAGIGDIRLWPHQHVLRFTGRYHRRPCRPDQAVDILAILRVGLDICPRRPENLRSAGDLARLHHRVATWCDSRAERACTYGRSTGSG